MPRQGLSGEVTRGMRPGKTKSKAASTETCLARSGKGRRPAGETVAYIRTGVGEQSGRALGHWEMCAFYSKPSDCLKSKSGMISSTFQETILANILLITD